MTNERLEALKAQVALAEMLAEHITALTNIEHEADSHKLPYTLRGEVYRLGREMLLKKKEAELESLLTPPAVDSPVTSATLPLHPPVSEGTWINSSGSVAQ